MILHAVVSGDVQGVGYRYWLLREARRLDLAGYTQNLFDGSVEVEAEGTGRALRELEMLLWQGPRMARVDRVETNYRNIARNYAHFEIRR
ncbi:MAG: acylphosphatase [bacterium]|nr:acylphosphatase [Candidatus Sumerlaeota bacterium]